MNENKRAYEVWNLPNLTRAEKAAKLNKEFNNNWNERTWQQRAKLYGEGFQDGLENGAPSEELKRLAKKHGKILVDQKLNTMIKAQVHKDARKLADFEVVKQTIKEFQPGIKIEPIKRKAHMMRNKSEDVIEYIISDLHFKGGNEEKAHVVNIFDKIRHDAIINGHIADDKIEIRLSFLGDDIEGMSAHDSQLYEIKAGAIHQTLTLSEILVREINKFFGKVTTKTKTIAFVPYSNHGLAFGQKKARYQFPQEDYGCIILDILKAQINDDVHFFDVDHDRFIVDSGDTIYTHGHQGYMRSPQQMQQVLGTNRDIVQGHLHHFSALQKSHHYHIIAPTCRLTPVDYERMAGYESEPQILKRIRINHGNAYELIDIKDK